MAMRIQFGKPLGRRATHDAWTFVACIGAPDGDSFRASHRLVDHVDVASAPPVLRRALAEGFDAAWVRGRLPRVFAYACEAPSVEKSLMFESIAAVRGDDAYVFHCTDHYGKTALMFSEDGPVDATKGEIASAFWSLLLSEPDELEDYRLKIFHPGTGTWLEYACEGGEVSLMESES
jgi:hypothetical protein